MQIQRSVAQSVLVKCHHYMTLPDWHPMYMCQQQLFNGFSHPPKMTLKHAGFFAWG